MLGRFEKKLHDLELTRMVSVQMSPQIRMIQNNDNVMVEKIQTTLMNTIPLWKNQMVLALGIAHSNEAAQAQRQVGFGRRFAGIYIQNVPVGDDFRPRRAQRARQACHENRQPT